MFLLKAGLSKEEFIGTGSAIAVLVDLVRFFVYFKQIGQAAFQSQAYLLAAAISGALLGTILGSKLLKKTSVRQIEIAASVLLLIIAVLLGSGLI